MRSEEEIKNIILDKAKADNRIRAVLLNGSRANPKIIPDPLQDFDIVFIVNQLESFTADHSWVSIFGDRLIWQLPDEMTFNDDRWESTCHFHYLMLFKDQNRIDLTLVQKVKMEDQFKMDSLTIVWLDKDGMFPNIGDPSDADYLIKPPTEKEFSDTCNEFWWVCTYVAKGVLRNEITYAKSMMENPVRKMFMLMIEWYIGTKTDFAVSFGKEGKFINKYLSAAEYNSILSTYPDYKTQNIWNSLFEMTSLFSEFAMHVANKKMFTYNLEEQNNILEYLHQQYDQAT
jgi:aminoglycoside 6-adenylyltransferase